MLFLELRSFVVEFDRNLHMRTVNCDCVTVRMLELGKAAIEAIVIGKQGEEEVFG
jgi:hypothetical protein